MHSAGNTPSPAELRALRAVAEHGTVRAAAESLFLSRYTVDFHIDELRRKTGLRYVPQLIAWAASHGWLDKVCQLSDKTAEFGGGITDMPGG